MFKLHVKTFIVFSSLLSVLVVHTTALAVDEKTGNKKISLSFAKEIAKAESDIVKQGFSNNDLLMRGGEDPLVKSIFIAVVLVGAVLYGITKSNKEATR